MTFSDRVRDTARGLLPSFVSTSGFAAEIGRTNAVRQAFRLAETFENFTNESDDLEAVNPEAESKITGGFSPIGSDLLLTGQPSDRDRTELSVLVFISPVTNTCYALVVNRSDVGSTIARSQAGGERWQCKIDFEVPSGTRAHE